MPSWPQISRDDLKVAAKRAGFDMVLPILIWRLIAETGSGITEVDMPGVRVRPLADSTGSSRPHTPRCRCQQAARSS
jgi:hypothetical protein